MGYRVGQFRRDQYSKNYYTDLVCTHNLDEISPQGGSSNEWKDSAILLSSNSYFKKDKLYYIKVTLTGASSTNPTKILVKLKSTVNTNEMIVGEYDWNVDTTYEIIFSPNNNNYNKIVFEIQRNQTDYQDPTRVAKIYENGYKVQEVTDIIEEFLKKTYSSLLYLDKIGLQGPPGMLFSINGEQMRIGSSGYYELEDIIINQIGFIPKRTGKTYKDEKNALEYFILDFQY